MGTNAGAAREEDRSALTWGDHSSGGDSSKGGSSVPVRREECRHPCRCWSCSERRWICIDVGILIMGEAVTKVTAQLKSAWKEIVMGGSAEAVLQEDGSTLHWSNTHTGADSSGAGLQVGCAQPADTQHDERTIAWHVVGSVAAVSCIVMIDAGKITKIPGLARQPLFF